MRVLVACEFSGTVRDAFAAQGHDAWSCDVLPSERPGQHFQMPVEALLSSDPRWDLMIAHPPCTFLAVSGARWFKDRRAEQAAAVFFARWLMEWCGIPRICVENPVSVLSSFVRKPDQIIQPWQFGHGETKATCLWLKGLPLLHATHTEEPLFGTEAVKGREARVHNMPPGPNRWRERSRTFPGIARAMAEQWGAATTATKES